MSREDRLEGRGLGAGAGHIPRATGSRNSSSNLTLPALSFGQDSKSFLGCILICKVGVLGKLNEIMHILPGLSHNRHLRNGK